MGQLNADETVVFFPTAAYLSDDADNQQWHIPIHGWVFEPEQSRVRKAAVAELLERKYGLQADQSTQVNFDRRVNLFLADNERGKRLRIRIGEHIVQLSASSANGHFHSEVILPVAEVDELAIDGVLHFQAVLKQGDKRRLEGKVQLIGKTGISIISDIDDTIKITHVGDKTRLLDQTFFQPFQAVPGMADHYQQWFQQDVAIHFVSSSPWQLYLPLAEFTHQAGFPLATFSLKSVRFKDKSLLNLFKPGLATKPLQIEPLLQRYPQRQFILIGDSGEQDPEIYASLMRQYGQQILRIFIRNVTNENADGTRFTQVFAGIGRERWQLFKLADEINN